MNPEMEIATARARIAYPERFAPDGTQLAFLRGRDWDQKRATWEARQPVQALVKDELEDALEVLEPSADPVDADDPFAGIPEADLDAPYVRTREAS